MAWTKEQFIAFCQKCGVDPNKALKEGKVSVREHKPTGAAQATIAAKKKRKSDAIKAIRKVQDSLREPDQAVALDKEACGEVEELEHPAAGFRISLTGLRVRPIDPDNYAAGCKALVDGIVASGIVPRDDWKTVTIRATQRKVNYGEEGTWIEIESGNNLT